MIELQKGELSPNIKYNLQSDEESQSKEKVPQWKDFRNRGLP
jgi:hypothetical protein